MVVGELTENADLVIVGGGPGGYVAAIRAAELGREVLLVERGDIGGVCLNVGCIPSKAIITVADQLYRIRHAGSLGLLAGDVEVSIQGVKAFKQQVVNRLTGGVRQLLKVHGVTVKKAEAYFLGSGLLRVVSEYETEKVAFKQAIVATGSHARLLPGIPLDGQVVIDSTALLDFERIPDHLVVVGGGYIGLELGTAFRKFGSRVTVVEATASLLPGTDPRLVRVLTRRLAELDIAVHLNTQVAHFEVHDQEAVLTLSNGRGTLTADQVLLSVGRQPNTENLNLGAAGITPDDNGRIPVDERLRTHNPSIAAIGDIVPGPLLAHKASYQGKIAAESLSGLPSAADAVVIPAVIFTDPEIAVAGLSEEAAQAAGYKTVVGRFPFAANGRALTLDQSLGEAVVVADEPTGLLLGLGIVGPEASNVIAEGGLALEMGATLEDLAMTIHAHPTLPETLMEAAEAALGRPIHIAPKRGVGRERS
ncbi:MAG: dihydrolipoyl dehydrogenase [Sulfobacillus benefaciens]|jgi:dihydrolipoamide dehydrogenase|uniref:Dihydrolipoyl dehydrogenase n=1 Tax=Sulfobacillus benefaciens TaxID=453960 RepID=A0A2T2X943_9FIRM|nr:MAG: dihydrolipoyl dehydrogenase [Sulfobacillus benefaciens]